MCGKRSLRIEIRNPLTVCGRGEPGDGVRGPGFCRDLCGYRDRLPDGAEPGGGDPDASGADDGAGDRDRPRPKPDYKNTSRYTREPTPHCTSHSRRPGSPQPAEAAEEAAPAEVAEEAALAEAAEPGVAAEEAALAEAAEPGGAAEEAALAEAAEPGGNRGGKTDGLLPVGGRHTRHLKSTAKSQQV